VVVDVEVITVDDVVAVVVEWVGEVLQKRVQKNLSLVSSHHTLPLTNDNTPLTLRLDHE
jgi:hypothetical protein